MTAIAGQEDQAWETPPAALADSVQGEAVVTGEPERPVSPRQAAGLRWWKELAYILVFYGIYTVVRDTQGSAIVSATHAFNNAKRVIHLERDLWIFREQAIQHAFLSWHWLLRILDTFYGSAHFVVTAVALIWLFHKVPERYAVWRNTLALTTALALVGFAFFPLMPPRLLGPYGYHFVDTLRAVGGSWNFDSGTMQKLSNQYAAMPSLHFAWSSWCVAALWPSVRSRAGRSLLVAYPLFTLFCIVVTANHYFLDAAGGVVVLLAGMLLARVLRGVVDARRARSARSARGAS